ncbi:EAL and HDOD domain-containing protein [Paraglaciecola sp. 2405UD69-4]|uniref:EAL and HDOD domain-containing protein n=1 Tax=Paraglaciecola sp. 2405UD69-4 TaxID=3391836 RepID=UPI0039C916C6
MNFYVARQPILNKSKALYAYELLFRDGVDNVFPEINDDEATAKLIDGLEFNLGLNDLTDGSLAFINFTQETLLRGYPLLLPKEQVVVEILETAKPGKKLLAACIHLKKQGYKIALDDYEHQAVWLHFFPYVDIIKIDYSLTSEAQFAQIVSLVKGYPQIKLLAEKIETHTQYQHAIQIGCEYFQGYFFSKPEVVKTVAFNPTQLSVVNLMSECNKTEPDLNVITSIFEGDANLSYKLLRYAQSPIFKRSITIESIKQAVVVLGMQELQRFISLLFSAQFSQEKPKELTVMALVRARFCELMVLRILPKSSQSSAFLMGLLSLIDAMVDGDLQELLDKLPISNELKEAIINRVGKHADFLKLCELYENAEWQNIKQFCTDIKIDYDDAALTFQESFKWASARMDALYS